MRETPISTYYTSLPFACAPLTLTAVTRLALTVFCVLTRDLRLVSPQVTPLFLALERHYTLAILSRRSARSAFTECASRPSREYSVPTVAARAIAAC